MPIFEIFFSLSLIDVKWYNLRVDKVINSVSNVYETIKNSRIRMYQHHFQMNKTTEPYIIIIVGNFHAVLDFIYISNIIQDLAEI